MHSEKFIKLKRMGHCKAFVEHGNNNYISFTQYKSSSSYVFTLSVVKYSFKHPPEAIVSITVPTKFLNLPHYTHLKCKSKTAYYCIGKRYIICTNSGPLCDSPQYIYHI